MRDRFLSELFLLYLHQMITFQSIANFTLALAIVIYWTAAFLVLYHLIRFGVSGQPKKIAVIFLGGSLLLTMIVVLLFSQVDLTAFKNLNTINLFQFQ